MCCAINTTLLLQVIIIHVSWYSKIEFQLVISPASTAGTKEERKDEWDKKFHRIHLASYRPPFFLLVNPYITQQAFDRCLKQAVPLWIISEREKLWIKISLNPWGWEQNVVCFLVIIKYSFQSVSFLCRIVSTILLVTTVRDARWGFMALSKALQMTVSLVLVPYPFLVTSKWANSWCRITFPASKDSDLGSACLFSDGYRRIVSCKPH